MEIFSSSAASSDQVYRFGHSFRCILADKLPRVEVEIAQEDRRGRVIPATVLDRLIARDVSLDLRVERAGTCLKPF